MLTSLALIFLCGLILGVLFKKIGLPSLIGMLITGIILGPYVLNLLDDSILSISADLRQLALVIILTRAGLSLDIDDLKKVGRPAVLMSFVPACFEMLGTIFLGIKLFNIPLLDAAILAAVVASASPAVIVPRMVKLIETGYGTDKKIPQLILAGDSIDDMFNIVVFTSLLGLTNGEEVSAMRFAEIPLSILFGILAGVSVGFLLITFFRKVHIRDSAKVVILLSIAFIMVALEEVTQNIFPFSGLLAVMTSGVVILKSAPVVANRISIKFSKLWVVAEILLFVLVGASVNIGYAADAGPKTLLLLILVLSMRAVGILICLIKTNLNWKERMFCTFTGIPKATVQAAIGGIPLAMGLPNGGIMFAVAVVAILFTAPLGAFLIDSTYKSLLSSSKVRNG
jgi:NhaP-type Na+/H+ and K+/H+ antiporters